MKYPKDYLMVDLNNYPPEKKPSTTKTLFELDEKGQAKFIEVSDGNTPKEQASLIKNLKALGSKSNLTLIDKTRLKSKLVFTIERPPLFFVNMDVSDERNDLNEKYSSEVTDEMDIGLLKRMYPSVQIPDKIDNNYSVYFHNEAERINYLKIRFEINEKGEGLYQFVNWSLLNTKYGTANLGQITQDNSATATFGGSFTRPDQFVDLDTLEKSLTFSPSANLTAKRTEALTLTDRFVDISGKLGDTEGEIVQEGVLGRDLAGNISVDVELKLSGKKRIFLTFGKLFNTDKNGVPILSEPLHFREINFGYTIEIQPTESALNPENSKVDGLYTFIVRDVKHRNGPDNVRKGSKSFSEADDKVIHKYGISKFSAPLLNEMLVSEIKKSLTRGHRLTWGDREFKITIGDPVGDDSLAEGTLYFKNLDDATKFVRWYYMFLNKYLPILKQQQSEIGRKTDNMVSDINFLLSKSNMSLFIPGEDTVYSGNVDPKPYDFE